MWGALEAVDQMLLKTLHRALHRIIPQHMAVKEEYESMLFMREHVIYLESIRLGK